jgi:hypothetical protein
MAYPFVDKKILVIKANWFPPTFDVGCGCIAIQFVLISTFFISRHSWLMDWGFLVVSVLTNWSVFPIAGCNPVGITSRVAPSGSIPSHSTN